MKTKISVTIQDNSSEEQKYGRFPENKVFKASVAVMPCF